MLIQLMCSISPYPVSLRLRDHFWYESYIVNDCGEFQFRYQFVTAIYAKNLQEDNIIHVFDLVLSCFTQT